ncbi:urocortin 3, like [Clupea harengus]|uniref:Urocortin 3, like n=1 Tax=Clupea harengus TaxID=7950 RepID=A0A6P3VS71_CLUHA|nr:urocortin 3, like [Clupea harengus]
MPLVRTLLLLAVLCAPSSSLCFRLYETESNFLCSNDVLSGAKSNEQPNNVLLDRRGFLIGSEENGAESAESREKRTYPAPNYRFLSHTQLRSKMYRNSAKGNRRSKVTLSLDVPTNIMNILFDIAKAKNLRAKAADNARLMAKIGKRK